VKVRIRIDLPKSLIRDVEKLAGKRKRSAFIEQALLEYLQRSPDERHE
jgi:metal-responsive CopG/Arc/MetJ family transcriptional regulator